MSNDLTVPFAGQKPSQAIAQAIAGKQDSLADGIGQSYAVLQYKGKVWTLRHRGERHIIVRPDDGSPSNYIDVIILNQNSHKSKSYYKDFDQNSSEGARPICASIDGVKPDADVQIK